MHGKHMDEKQMAKPFEMEWPTDARMKKTFARM